MRSSALPFRDEKCADGETTHGWSSSLIMKNLPPGLGIASACRGLASFICCSLLIALMNASALGKQAPVADEPVDVTLAEGDREMAKSLGENFPHSSDILGFEVLRFIEVEQRGELAPKRRGYGPTVRFAVCRVLTRLYGDCETGTEFLIDIPGNYTTSKELVALGVGGTSLANLAEGGFFRGLSDLTVAAIDSVVASRRVLRIRSNLVTFSGEQGGPRYDQIAQLVRQQLAHDLPCLRGGQSGLGRGGWHFRLGPKGPLKLWRASYPKLSSEPDAQVQLNATDHEAIRRMYERMAWVGKGARLGGSRYPDDGPHGGMTIYTVRGSLHLGISYNATEQAPTIEARAFAMLARRVGLLDLELPELDVLRNLRPLEPAAGISVSVEELAQKLARELTADALESDSIVTFEVIEQLSLHQREELAMLDHDILPLRIPLLRCRVLETASGALQPGDEFLMFVERVDGFELAWRNTPTTKHHLGRVSTRDAQLESGLLRIPPLSTVRKLEQLAKGRAVVRLRAEVHRIEGRFVRDDLDLVPLDLVMQILREEIR